MRSNMNSTLICISLLALSLVVILPVFSLDDSNDYLKYQQENARFFHQETIKFTQKVNEFCEGIEQLPSSYFLPLKTHWLNTIAAWQPFLGSNYGNDAALDLSWGIQFYPDHKDLIGRQTSKLVHSTESITVESLIHRGVATKGLGAIEWMLTDHSNKGMIRCDLLIAQTYLLDQQAAALHQAWLNFKLLENERNKFVYQSILSQIESVNKTLSYPMGKAGYPNPYKAQAWRSKRSLFLLKKGIESIISASTVSLIPLLNEKDEKILSVRLSTQLENILLSLPNSDDLSVQLQSEEGYRKLLMLKNQFDNLIFLMTDEIAPALSLTLNFNAKDGD